MTARPGAGPPRRDAASADRSLGRGGPAGAGRPPAARRYGQHHLVDRGTLDAILRLADVRRDDVVLEVGAADGLLTRPLLAAAAHVHTFEVDQRFTPALDDLLAEHHTLTVHLRDALRADLGALLPAPTVLVANLAYNIAIPVIMKSLQELPEVRRWAVMVQKELGERLFARPSTKPYSAVSVQVQLACRPLASRPIPRSVFSPQPRVDSVFVVFERRVDGPDAPSSIAVRRLARAAFSQRRKMLSNSLSGLQWPLLDSSQSAVLTAVGVREALSALDISPSSRPEELTPEQFVDLARRLGEG